MVVSRQDCKFYSNKHRFHFQIIVPNPTTILTFNHNTNKSKPTTPSSWPITKSNTSIANTFYEYQHTFFYHHWHYQPLAQIRVPTNAYLTLYLFPMFPHSHSLCSNHTPIHFVLLQLTVTIIIVTALVLSCRNTSHFYLYGHVHVVSKSLWAICKGYLMFWIWIGHWKAKRMKKLWPNPAEWGWSKTINSYPYWTATDPK